MKNESIISRAAIELLFKTVSNTLDSNDLKEMKAITEYVSISAKHLLTPERRFVLDQLDAERIGMDFEEYYYMTYDVDGEYGAPYNIEDGSPRNEAPSFPDAKSLFLYKQEVSEERSTSSPNCSLI